LVCSSSWNCKSDALSKKIWKIKNWIRIIIVSQEYKMKKI
jgi:hypothetical protein